MTTAEYIIHKWETSMKGEFDEFMLNNKDMMLREDKEYLIDELIGFQIYLNNKNKINNFDWDYEKEAEKYYKTINSKK